MPLPDDGLEGAGEGLPTGDDEALGQAGPGEPQQAASEPELVVVSLRYWHTGSQCLSEWQHKELKKLRSLIDKVQGLSPDEVRTDPGIAWKLHAGPPKGKGFSRPKELSADVPLGEMRVSVKARVHGALFDSTFFLVWLDRNHEVFPE